MQKGFAKIGILLAFVAVLCIATFSGVRVFAVSLDKVNICHKTASSTNPWVAQSVNANELQSHLANGDFLYEGPVNKNGQPTSNTWCCNHVPKPTPTLTPSPSPTPTPKPCNNDFKKDENCETPTPTPTTKPCVVWEGEFPVPCPSTTPTPSVSPTPTPTPDEQSGGGTGNVPSNPHTDTTEAPGAATCNIPFSAPVLVGFSIAGKGSVKFSWLSSAEGVDKFSIRYGYTKDDLVYGQDNIPASDRDVTLNLLQSGNHVWAIVSAWKGGCAVDSNELDPKIR